MSGRMFVLTGSRQRQLYLLTVLRRCNLHHQPPPPPTPPAFFSPSNKRRFLPRVVKAASAAWKEKPLRAFIILVACEPTSGLFLFFFFSKRAWKTIRRPGAPQYFMNPQLFITGSASPLSGVAAWSQAGLSWRLGSGGVGGWWFGGGVGGGGVQLSGEVQVHE